MLDTLIARISQLSVKMRLYKSYLQPKNEPNQLSDRQVLILELLKDQGSMSLVALCSVLKCYGQSTISADIKTLRADRGFVQIIVKDDARIHLFTLTATGHEKVDNFRCQRAKLYAPVAKVLPTKPEERKIIQDTVDAAIENLDEELGRLDVGSG